MEIILQYSSVRPLNTTTPSKSLGALENRQISSSSAGAFEEEKLDYSMVELSGTQSKGPQVKLAEVEEKQLRQLLRLGENPEVLFRIFKMINQFYVKFSELKDAGEVEPGSSREALAFVKGTYED